MTDAEHQQRFEGVNNPYLNQQRCIQAEDPQGDDILLLLEAIP